MALKLRQYTLDANNGITTFSYIDVPPGTVTSVAQTFTGGLISVAGSPITSSGTLALTVAGTSGGVPYFSSGTTWATSAALAAAAIVLGGGAGAAPATTTTGANVVTALGVAVGSAGAFVVNGGVLGTPSSGTATNLSGTAAGLTAGTVTTNANLTGPITSAGNATAVAAQTGTGSVFAMQASPALTTPTLGVAAATSINFGQDALNYYDEGTWTPVVNGVTLTDAGKYTRIGNKVFLSFNNQVLGSTTIANNVDFTISGLPFNIAAGGYAFGAPVSINFADASDSYHLKLCAGIINSSDLNTIGCTNQSGVTIAGADDPINLSGFYTAA